MFLVMDCKELNRVNGLDLRQLMTLLFLLCLCDEVVFGKGAFPNPVPSMQGIQMVRLVSNTLVKQLN